MDLQQLFKMQSGLDSHIEQNHDLENRSLFNEKIVALLVELGELANETRCFKFWSLKGASKEEIILEEFVDGIHFILSLGLELNFDEQLTVIKPENNNNHHNLTDQFLKIYQLVNQFNQEKTFSKYEQLFGEFLKLGEMLDFSSKQIYDAYIEKNEINFARQDQGY